MDYFYGKISNALNFWAMGMALVFQLANNGAHGCIEGLGNAGLVFGLMMPVYFLRGIGGGDVKVFLCVAVFLEPFAGLKFIFMVFLLGGMAGIGKKFTGDYKKTKIKLGIYMPLAHVIAAGIGGIG